MLSQAVLEVDEVRSESGDERAGLEAPESGDQILALIVEGGAAGHDLDRPRVAFELLRRQNLGDAVEFARLVRERLDRGLRPFGIDLDRRVVERRELRAQHVVDLLAEVSSGRTWASTDVKLIPKNGMPSDDQKGRAGERRSGRGCA